MSRAIWSKSFRDVRLLAAALAVLMFLFQWLFVWLSSMIEAGPFSIFLQSLPPAFEKLVGLPFSKVLSAEGRIALAYVDPVVIFSMTAWAISRGSDCVSGEIGRGTMELLLAQPVRRSSLILIPAVVTTLGAALLAASALAGTSMGLATVPLKESVSIAPFVPAALNLFGLTFCLAGMTAALSAAQSQRWRTIGTIAAIYVLSLILKVVAQLAPSFEWLKYLSFLSAFQPQSLIISPSTAWADSLIDNGTLLAIGLAGYVAATVLFCRRDVPAPM